MKLLNSAEIALICIVFGIIILIIVGSTLIFSKKKNKNDFIYLELKLPKGSRQKTNNDALDSYLNTKRENNSFKREYDLRIKSLKYKQSKYQPETKKYKQLENMMKPYNIIFSVRFYSERGYERIYKNSFKVRYSFILSRYTFLARHKFTTTREKYNSNKQRSLVTPEIKEYVCKRDNFTCQICGRYMPDGFGINIDHIIPIAKGGKSVPDNLQVLCYKCNGKKRDKILEK